MAKISSSGKVAIVGAGRVGCTAAYALMLGGAVSSIALIDTNKEQAEGEALDLNHCMQFTRVATVTAGDSFELVAGADVVVLTAGAAQRVGQSRSDLLAVNAAIFKNIIPHIVRHNKECILLVVTNPLDVMTYLTWKLSGFSSCQVFGTGTVLDSARLRYLLGEHFQVSPKDVTAYALGEHGDASFVWWSGATIGGIPLPSFTRYDKKIMDDIAEKTRCAAEQIIAKKGSTFYAIGLVIAKIVQAIILNQPRVLSVSAVVHNALAQDVCLSLPTIVRRGGVCEMLPVVLSQDEQDKLAASVLTIKNEIEKGMSYI